MCNSMYSGTEAWQGLHPPVTEPGRWRHQATGCGTIADRPPGGDKCRPVCRATNPAIVSAQSYKRLPSTRTVCRHHCRATNPAVVCAHCCQPLSAPVTLVVRVRPAPPRLTGQNRRPPLKALLNQSQGEMRRYIAWMGEVPGAMAAGSERPAAADHPGAHAKGVGAVVLHPAFVPGLEASATAEALDRDPHTIGRWASAFGEGGPAALIFEPTGGSPPALDQAQQVKNSPTPATVGVAPGQWRPRRSAMVCRTRPLGAGSWGAVLQPVSGQGGPGEEPQQDGCGAGDGQIGPLAHPVKPGG